MKKFFTSLFQKLLINKDIRSYKKNIFYYLLFRIFRNFLEGSIIINIFNFKIYTSVNKNKASHSILKKCDFDDQHEIEIINKISNINKVFFLDCGCNYGFYSFFAASLSKKNIILAYEASGSTIKEFNKNLSLNSLQNINCKNLAISDENNKWINFNESVNDWESSASHDSFNKKNISKIKTTTIDIELKDYDLKDFTLCIKLDIEGSEFQAIQGGLETIQKYAPIIIIEISKYNINEMNSNFNFFNDFLFKNDYIIFDLNQNEVKIEEIKKRITDVDQNHHTIGNFYLVKNNHKLIKIFKKDE
ncbi:FkbM family methyltransferase [Candidatus Pelagibacter sp.]|nr:FkbM family methyltransferase [Candidatus Pelagibacter sp.]